jgi:hypothetical protein
MARRVVSDLLLVGSLPADSTEQAFRAGAELFGDMIFALPDGETGPRAMWAAYEALRMVYAHPDLEMTGPATPGSDISPHVYAIPAYRVRAGVTEVGWDSWPRIDDAIVSYRQFARLRQEGVIRPELRFQVGLPFPASALQGVLKGGSAKDWRTVEHGWLDLAARELARLTAEIPAADLAIQWDVCWEVLDLEGVLAWAPGGAWERFTRPVERLTPLIPEDVLVGYHLCYGTFPAWPMFEARDLSLLVRMANYAAAHSGRQVDWFHVPGPRDLRSEDDRYYRPLTGLRVGDARVYLGIVLPVDGVEGLERRHSAASKYLADFGVANYCGFGRQPGHDGMETLREHQRTVRAISYAAEPRTSLHPSGPTGD